MEHFLIMIRHELKEVAEKSKEIETKKKLYNLIDLAVREQEEYYN
mgnify:FL=1